MGCWRRRCRARRTGRGRDCRRARPYLGDARSALGSEFHPAFHSRGDTRPHADHQGADRAAWETAAIAAGGGLAVALVAALALTAVAAAATLVAAAQRMRGTIMSETAIQVEGVTKALRRIGSASSGVEFRRCRRAALPRSSESPDRARARCSASCPDWRRPTPAASWCRDRICRISTKRRWPNCAAGDRHRVPELQPDSIAVGAGKCPVADLLRPRTPAAERRQRAIDLLEQVGLGRAHASSPFATQRRRAAARRDCARALVNLRRSCSPTSRPAISTPKPAPSTRICCST